MSYNNLHLDLLKQGLANRGVVSLHAPDSDADYPAFHERVDALKELDTLGLVRCRVQVDHMRPHRTYYVATATFTDEGREEAERLQALG